VTGIPEVVPGGRARCRAVGLVPLDELFPLVAPGLEEAGGLVEAANQTSKQSLGEGSSQDLVKEVLRITGGKGASVVFDPVGGPTVNKLVQATAQLGIVFLYGALSTEPAPLPLFDLLAKWATIRGYVMMEITSDPQRLERAKKFINEGLADGSFKPLIAKKFLLDQIVEAHRYLESNQQVGKVVVTV
jgi:NADPH:quinone reductase-like Zn-dependent oxidoreductase